MRDSMDVLDEALEKLQGAKRYGRYVAAICPFHTDSKPSLLVFPDGYRCTACGAYGTIAYLFSHVGASALVPVVDKPHYYPNLPDSLTNDQLVRSANHTLRYTSGLQQELIRRKVERAIDRYDWGYYEGWFTIPVKREDDGIQQVIFRASPWVQEQTGERFYQRLGQKIILYVPDWRRLKPGRMLFVTFGLFDAMTLNLLKYAACSATVGKASFNPEWLSFWEGPITIIPDLMEEKEAHVLAAKLGWRGRVWLPHYPEGCKDPNDLVQRDPDYLQRSLYELERSQSDRFRVGPGGALLPRRRTPHRTGTSV